MVLKPSYPEELLTQKSSGSWELFVSIWKQGLAASVCVSEGDGKDF